MTKNVLSRANNSLCDLIEEDNLNSKVFIPIFSRKIFQNLEIKDELFV